MNVSAFNVDHDQTSIISYTYPKKKENAKQTRRNTLCASPSFTYAPPSHYYSEDGCCNPDNPELQPLPDLLEPNETAFDDNKVPTQLIVNTQSALREAGAVEAKTDTSINYADLINRITEAANSEDGESPNSSVKVVVLNFFFPDSIKSPSQGPH